MQEAELQRKLGEFVNREVIYPVSNLIFHLMSDDTDRENLFDNFTHLFQAFDDEGEPVEIYEHWIVTDRLADKLIEHGESVEKDFFGLTIWGRATTGQAIMLDCVIREIYQEYHS